MKEWLLICGLKSESLFYYDIVPLQYEYDSYWIRTRNWSGIFQAEYDSYER